MERERERQREKSKLFNRVFSIIIRQSICVRMQRRVIRGMEGGCRGWGRYRGRGGGFRESRSTIRKLWIYYLTGSFGSLRSDGASIMAGASLWAIFMRQNATHLNRAAGPKWGKKKKKKEGEKKKREKRKSGFNRRNTCMKNAWPDFWQPEKNTAESAGFACYRSSKVSTRGSTGRANAPTKLLRPGKQFHQNEILSFEEYLKGISHSSIIGIVSLLLLLLFYLNFYCR